MHQALGYVCMLSLPKTTFLLLHSQASKGSGGQPLYNRVYSPTVIDI